MSDMPIPSYPKVYHLGHKALDGLWTGGTVVIQEKVDGSQISFARFEDGVYARSKKQPLIQAGADVSGGGMFDRAIERILQSAAVLPIGHIYRGEYLQSPKHNTLTYDRVPDGHIAIYDIETRPSYFVPERALRKEAKRIGFEAVWAVEEHLGEPPGLDWFDANLRRVSALGGSEIEGLVVKNREMFGKDGKMLAGKFVSERFKEKHQKGWKKANPNRKDVVAALVDELRTEARWDKAVQHLREEGTLEESPRDIGPLMKELAVDTEVEEAEHIKDVLYKHFRKDIIRGVQRGFPEWYKRELARKGLE